MLPKKEFNIYPRTEENLQALISFYFDGLEINQEHALDTLNKKPSLTLNQLEFIFRKLAEAYEPIFKKHLNGQITLTNLIEYGVDALKNTEPSKSGSKNRKMITKEFKEFVKRTEVDFTHFGKNN
jgi:hypothetical protein